MDPILGTATYCTNLPHSSRASIELKSFQVAAQHFGQAPNRRLSNGSLHSEFLTREYLAIPIVPQGTLAEVGLHCPPQRLGSVKLIAKAVNIQR